MQPTQRLLILIITIPMILLISMLIWYFKSEFYFDRFDSEEVYLTSGQADLTGRDFDKEVFVIKGDVEYIEGELFTPEEFEENEDKILVGPTGAEVPVCTSRITIKVPDDRVYMIAGSSIDFSERIYINGKWRGDFGKPGKTGDEATPGTGLFYYEAEPDPETGTIEIIQQSSNFVHRSGGGHTNFQFGDATNVKQFVSLRTDLTTAVLGILLVLFMVHITLYLVYRPYRANLYFALFCLAWFFRTGVEGAKIFQSWFPDIPWIVAFRIEYVAMPAACILIILMIYELFPGIIQNMVIKILTVLFGIFALIFIFADSLTMSWVIIGCEALFVMVSIYFVIRLIVKLRNVSMEQTMTLFGIGFFIFSAIHAVFYYNNIYLLWIDHQLTDIAFLIFSLSQMTAMFIGTFNEVHKAREKETAARTEAEALKRANEMKEEFLGDLYHELQMPITVMSGFAQLSDDMLSDPKPDGAEVKENMKQIVYESERMQKMIGQLLDEAVIESGSFTMNMKAVNINDLLTQIESSHSWIPLLEGNNLSMSVAEDLPLAYGDEERIVQVITNLISNAVKHTHHGNISISAKKSDEFIVISVADTGKGIDPDVLPIIFERYMGNKSAGERRSSGLGLYITKKIIDAHGGSIDVESIPGKGAVFTFTLKAYGGENQHGRSKI